MKKLLFALMVLTAFAAKPAFCGGNWSAEFVPGAVQLLVDKGNSKTFLIIYDKNQVGYAAEFNGSPAATAWYDMAKTAMVTGTTILVWNMAGLDVTVSWCTDFTLPDQTCTAPDSKKFPEIRQISWYGPK